VDDGELVFRPLTRADFPLFVNWLAQPHVAAWWGAPPDLDAVEEKYGPSIDGTDPTLLFIALSESAPLGMVQIYRLRDNHDYARAVGIDDAAGVDLLIGEESHTGEGNGTRMISAALGRIWDSYPEVSGAMAGVSPRNARSQRAFEKAGFTALRRVAVPGEEEDEVVYFFPRPTAK
jgi:aminoglycoside 6'-N-acetyltransferase